MAEKLTKDKTNGSVTDEAIEGDSKESESYEELFERSIQEALNSSWWKEVREEVKESLGLKNFERKEKRS